MLVFCVGMIRAGSTLQYNLARTLVAKLDLGRGEGFFKPDEVPDLEDRLDQWAKDDVLHVVKMHAVPPLAAELSAEGAARFCYVYRDIRDVAASAKRFWGARGPKLLEAVEGAIRTYHEVAAIPHLLSWKYEDLVGNGAAPVAELAAFLDLDAPPHVVASVLEECSLNHAKAVSSGMRHRLSQSLKRLLRRLGLPQSAVYHRDTLLHPAHISKTEGKSGIWRQGLDKQELGAILRRHGGWLQARGYEL